MAGKKTSHWLAVSAMLAATGVDFRDAAWSPAASSVDSEIHTEYRNIAPREEYLSAFPLPEYD